MLVKFVSSKKEKWSLYLDTCAFAYNTSRHNSTKITPFYLMFGRQAYLPVDADFQIQSPEELCTGYFELKDPDISSKEYQLVLEEAKRNILEAQMKQKKNYDKKHSKPGKNQVNSLVLKLDFKRKKSKGGKLKDRYVGPYKILSCLPHGVYNLQDNKGITIRATGSHLKIFHPDPSSSISNSSKTSPVDDFPSVKESDQSRRKDSKWSPAISEDDPPSEGESSHSVDENSRSSPPKSGAISEDDPPSEGESSHSVDEDPKSSPPKSGAISEDDPPSEGESSHSVDEDPKSSPPKSGAISEDDPPSEGESSHSVDEDPKSSPPKSGAISEDDPPSEGESSHSVDEDPKSSPPKSGAISEAPKSCTFGVHTSDEDSISVSICECKTRCATRRCPCKQIGSFCSKYCHPNRTCVNSHQEASETEPLSLSTEEETPVEKVWTTIGETTLLEEEKSILMNREWLNDKIIKAGMHLLKTAFPYISGFQDPMLQVTNTFNIQKSTEFIQCLNVAGMHWITIATVGCTPGTIRVYDSLNKKLTKALKNTVADLLHSSTKKIEVEYVNCQYQQGSEDCGLFAIANACELCFGGDPSVVKYTQDNMRKHLLKAFDTLRLMQFPSKMRRVSQHVLQREFIDIYCTCRMPNNGRPMIQCEVCKEWYHVDCVRAPRKVLNSSVRWCCGCK